MSLVARSLVVGRERFRRAALDLRTAPGERLAVLGPNGAGKSTLLKSLAGLLKPVAGAVEIDGVDVAAAPPAARAAAAAYLPPPGEVEAAYDAATMVAMGRIALGGSTRAALVAAHAALETLGVEGLAERRFDKLSTGERQQVLIARLMVQGAKVCLLDEPTAALDPGRRGRVVAALDALSAAGRVLLIATHDLDLASKCDRVLWLAEDGGYEVTRRDGFEASAFAERYA